MTTKKSGSAMANLLDEPATNQEPEQEITVPEQEQAPKTSVSPAPAPPINKPQAPINKPKSGRVKDMRSRYEQTKKQLSASLGISEKYLPPIMKRRTAIYQLLDYASGGKIDPRVVDGSKLIEPPPYELVPHYNFYDANETDLANSTKTLTFYEGNELVFVHRVGTDKKDAVSQRKIGNPYFTNGQVVIDIEKEYAKYVWFELHPSNKSNKHRPPNSPTAIFERIDTKFNTPHMDIIRMDLAADAENYIRTMDVPGMIALGASLRNPTIDVTVSPQELRLTLRHRARKNPEEVLFASPEKTANIKLNIIHALNMGLIMFDAAQEQYIYSDDGNLIYQVPIENQPLESLSKFLLTEEGNEHREMIEELLRFWY